MLQVLLRMGFWSSLEAHLMNCVDAIGVEENALSEGCLPRINMRRYANVPGGPWLLTAVLYSLRQCCKCPEAVHCSKVFNTVMV